MSSQPGSTANVPPGGPGGHHREGDDLDLDACRRWEPTNRQARSTQRPVGWPGPSGAGSSLCRAGDTLSAFWELI